MSTVKSEEFDSSPAKKGLGAFISQGSAGGAISNFLLMLLSVLRHPNGYNFLLIPYLPFILLMGSVLGAVGGILLWLLRPIFNFPFGWLVRSAAIVALLTMIFVVGGFREGSPLDTDLFVTSLVTAAVIVLPISILTSSKVQPWWLILLGSGRIAASEWHSMLAACTLRIGSLAGLLISLFFLAWWGSFLSAGWGVRLDPYYIAIGVLYFAASSYFASRPPSRQPLVIIALLLNAPLLVWALALHSAADSDAKFLEVIVFIFSGLWAAFLACLLFDNRFMPPGQRSIDIAANKRA